MEDNKTELLSLKDFIEEYQRVITVIGVFVALALFWKNIRAQEATPYISYICILTTLPLLIEVNRGYVYPTSSWNLVAFINLLNSLLVFTVYYLVVDYPQHFARILTAISLFAVFNVLMMLQKRILISFRKLDYDIRVKNVEVLKLQEKPVDEINQIAQRQVEKSSALLGLLEMVLFITAIIGSLIVVVYVDKYITASFDVILDRSPQIETPVMPSPSPKPSS